ncbi:4'-phosphopantetheinyl transferase family protein [Robiginitalea sediminis]|uniref:4'-phosphopantetheinyl transferase family protein n=1 Tax=Robiginitalea sediminis TaxID=1982593 RepID=UPI000B4A90D4|nr:4'-phosphopantetheinyl transferase superfamily protein [Robiginitalea sediminis]
MPLFKSLEAHPGCRILVWKITEPEAALAHGIALRPQCTERLEGMRSEIHRRGFLSIRHLLAEAGYTDFDLTYDAAGKPHLADGCSISITHSFGFSGIIVSKEAEVGIDIEMQRDKILRIAHKFTPLREYRSLANDEAIIRKLTMVWGAKESIYKVLSTPGLSFLNHIDIDDFDMDSGQSTGTALYQGMRADFRTYFLEFEGYTCAYAIRQ